MTHEIKRRNVVYARYQRALCVLVLLPLMTVREIVDPTRPHALWIAASVGMCTLAGWMHRESVSWWTDDPSHNR